ncbi:E3 ubiquitin-protein ligase synoviolin B-like isoform X1 [Eriocheir sinensis]|uniref:E3 ubiquitin-protein ligase synoviolin B-like isoform X1 n=1 Tax=Eriocheir sinensis TaxID=95602 RepID=UPI0021C80926|nr:E3 ubiquitin-protein ligase synoviolin B-like isoform X1 [Eriocheir sinensis]
MPAPMPVGGLTMASFALTAAVIGNAYYQKRQFYPSVVYITKSNPSMAAIYLLAFFLVILLGKLLKKVFFGSLRTAEFEHLVERSFYAVTETCLAFTVFRDDFSPKFVALFTVLLFLKAFHWLADYRVDFMERSPVITILFHTRVTSLLLLLSLLDMVLVNHAYHSTITRGASVQLVFGFEYAILLTVAINIAVKYICHTVDLQSENPWENKAMYLLYTELIMGFFKVMLYIVFLVIMIRIHTFPLFIIRPMYLTMRSFKRALNDVVLSRRAISNMNTLYPNATAEELTAVDNVCIICREEMLTGAKKLPCGHIFHASCLRSWFQRQQTCPTCRMDILRQPPPNGPLGQAAPQPQAPRPQPQQQPQPPPQPQPQPQPQGPQQIQNPFERLYGGFPMPLGPMPGGMPPFPFAAQPQPQQQQPATTTQATGDGGSSSSTSPTSNTTSSTTSSSSSSSSTTSTTTTTTTSMPAPPLGMMPPFFPFLPFNIPPPRPPPNFSAMSEEEVRRMEGSERQHVEARIRVLRNIQTLLDAAVVQMNQYASVVASLDMTTAAASTATTTTATAGGEAASSTRSHPTSTSSTDPAQQQTERETLTPEASPIPPKAPEPEPSTSESQGATAQSEEKNAPTSTTPEKSLESSPTQQAEGDDPQEEIRRRRLERFS